MSVRLSARTVWAGTNCAVLYSVLVFKFCATGSLAESSLPVCAVSSVCRRPPDHWCWRGCFSVCLTSASAYGAAYQAPRHTTTSPTLLYPLPTNSAGLVYVCTYIHTHIIHTCTYVRTYMHSTMPSRMSVSWQPSFLPLPTSQPPTCACFLSAFRCFFVRNWGVAWKFKLRHPKFCSA